MKLLSKSDVIYQKLEHIGEVGDYYKLIDNDSQIDCWKILYNDITIRLTRTFPDSNEYDGSYED